MGSQPLGDFHDASPLTVIGSPLMIELRSM